MKKCSNCHVLIKGTWDRCPLCQNDLKNNLNRKEDSKSSFLNPTLKFNRLKIFKTFSYISIILILIFFVTQLFYPFHFFGLEYVIFGLLITWMSILILLRKRRNIVKGIVYLLGLFSTLSLYFDYVNGKIGWSITFIIPILSIAAIIAMFVALQFVSLKVEDYVLYLQLVTIVGIVPLLFLIFNWVGHPLPSILSTIFSIIMFIFIFIKYRIKIIKELKKRMHI